MNPAQVHLSELMEARGPGTAEALAKFVGTGKSTAHRWQVGDTVAQQSAGCRTGTVRS